MLKKYNSSLCATVKFLIEFNYMIVVIYYKQKQLAHLFMENFLVLPIHIISFVHTLCIINNPLQVNFFLLHIYRDHLCMYETHIGLAQQLKGP